MFNSAPRATKKTKTNDIPIFSLCATGRLDINGSVTTSKGILGLLGPSSMTSNTFLNYANKEVEDVHINYATDANLRDTESILETRIFKIVLINVESPQSNI